MPSTPEDMAGTSLLGTNCSCAGADKEKPFTVITLCPAEQEANRTSAAKQRPDKIFLFIGFNIGDGPDHVGHVGHVDLAFLRVIVKNVSQFNQGIPKVFGSNLSKKVA